MPKMPKRCLSTELISPLFLAGPVVTDNGNFIIDAPFEREHMIDAFVVSEKPEG